MRPLRPATFPGDFALACALVLAACSGSPRPGRAPAAFVPDTKPAPPERWVDAIVPQGTRLRLTMFDRVGSDTARRGDSFRARMGDAFVQDDIVVIPSGSTVYGVVAQVTPAGTGFKNKGGSLVLAISRISTPTGAGTDMIARLVGLGPPAGREGAEIVGTADGGPDLARLLGRNPNDQRLAGAAPATAVASGSRGREAVLEAETPIDIVLERPLLIKVRH